MRTYEPAVGGVYFIATDDRSAVKVGYARGFKDRLATIQGMNPKPLTCIAWRPGGREREAELHRRLAAFHIHGEWFRLTPEVQDVIDEVRNRYIPPPEMRLVGNKNLRPLSRRQQIARDVVNRHGGENRYT